MATEFFYLFPSCKIVIGFKNSIIIDFDSKTFYQIPRDAGILLNQLNGKVIDYESENKFLNELISLQIAFISKFSEGIDINDYTNPDRTIKSINYKAIIEISNYTPNISKKITILNKFNFSSFEFLFSNYETNNVQLPVIENILKIKGIEEMVITFKQKPNDLNRIIDFTKNIKSVKNVVVYNANKDNISEKIILKNQTYDYRLIKPISQSFFIIDKIFYNLSTVKNNYHWGNIFVDIRDDIYLDQSKNLKICSLNQLSKNELLPKELYKYWDINKDKIHVCKDCEFRYICTDCRAYVEDPEDILSKPLKCGYNPYTGEWSEWSTNPLKQKAIDFYEMRDMVDEL